MAANPSGWITGYYLAIVGVITALIAAIPGFMDYFLTVPPRSSGKRRPEPPAEQPARPEGLLYLGSAGRPAVPGKEQQVMRWWGFLIPFALTVASGGSAQAVGPNGLRPDSAAVKRARADSVRRPYTEADIQFMSGMISHHAQAIAMANWAVSHRANESVQRLADRIINAQTDEISLMQHWLLDRNQPVPEPDPRGMRMTMGGTEHLMLMPGMLDPDQMRRLDAARGAEFDQLFLIYMIQHHRGAVEMVKELFSHPGAGQDEVVWKFASDVNVDQTTEIARMQRMLAALTLGIRAP